jgi:hypothetical protein
VLVRVLQHLQLSIRGGFRARLRVSEEIFGALARERVSRLRVERRRHRARVAARGLSTW